MARTIYIGIFLDEASKRELAELADHEVIKSDHLTLAFRPGMDVEGLYAERIGEVVEMEVTAFHSSAEIQAVSVKLPEDFYVASDVPHITVSHVAGVSPKHSIDLIQEGGEVPYTMKLRGRIGFFRSYPGSPAEIDFTGITLL